MSEPRNNNAENSDVALLERPKLRANSPVSHLGKSVSEPEGNRFALEIKRLLQCSREGKLGERGDVQLFTGVHKELVSEINEMLDTATEKVSWFEAVLDAVPFPVHVIDLNMKWTHLNKGFEKLMLDNKCIQNRHQAVGLPCSTATADICNTEKCGIRQLTQSGNPVSHFDWHGTKCKQDTAKIINAKGEHIGWVELVQDQTSTIKVKDYTNRAVQHLASNLVQISTGDLNVDLAVEQGDQFTTEVKAQFTTINESVHRLRESISAVVADASTLADAGANGQLDVRADASKHKGVFGELITNINGMLDAILLPIAEGNRILAQISIGKIDELITAQYKGDHEKMKLAVNHVGHVVQRLRDELGRLIQASRDGMLAERGKADQFTGAFSDLVTGINEMLDAIIKPLNVSADYVEQISAGNIPAKITDNYNGDFNKIKNSLNICIDSINALVADAGTLAQAGVDGKLHVRADANKHKGDYKKIVEGVNATLDSIAIPLTRAIEHLENLSHGKTPAIITRQYKGDFQRLTDGFNSLFVTINRLVEDATMLAQAGTDGKLTTRADASKHEGDFRKIVDGVNHTLDAVVTPIQEVDVVIAQMAAGDLTKQIHGEYPGDFNQLKTAVNTLSIQFGAAIRQIGKETTSLVASSSELNQVSQQMGASADETSTQANVVSAAAEQVSKNVQTVATGADEMGASIKEIAKSTSEATRVANLAVKTAGTTNQTIVKLGQSSADIGKVIKVITSIAQQTNLLALNATIEAARAGEAGKGFAVVANEVKELAKETAKATEDISQKIEAIQGDTKEAVSAIGEISGIIAQISDIQNTIASAIEEQSATTNEIIRNLVEAAKGTTDISSNIGGVAEAAHTTSAGASDTQQSARALEKMSAELQTLVSQFRV